MSNQREKDLEAYWDEGGREASYPRSFADGAEYARKELFERLRRGNWLKRANLEYLSKEYGL